MLNRNALAPAVLAITLGLATSTDGYIARPDGDVEMAQSAAWALSLISRRT
jgi:hypothetical protein